ncbi:hypothetical protein BGX38DRAFT_752011 [Terfezia claveryi]|nr:hypothetical protein BGX38DRAFT_752011 [Terfezia claveryi]
MKEWGRLFSPSPFIYLPFTYSGDMGAVRQIFYFPVFCWVLITIVIKLIIAHAIWFSFVCISVFTYPGVFLGVCTCFFFLYFLLDCLLFLLRIHGAYGK